MDDDEKDGVGITDPIGRPQQTTVISKSGLYSLVLRSCKPEAKYFKKWIGSSFPILALRHLGWMRIKGCHYLRRPWR
jgi:hypothetical protein